MQTTRPSVAPLSGTSCLEAHADMEWLRVLWERSPELGDCIDLARLEDGRQVRRRVAAASNDFDSTTKGGRGESYRRAQTSMFVRAHGIQQLFHLVSPGGDFRRLPRDFKVLDVLGGDGLLARVMGRVAGERFCDSILTSDLSEDMVRAAAAAGLAPICQAAQYLVLRDACVNGVLFAYGTHHIPRGDRLTACREAHRILKAGGKVLLHDFEEGSPVARWFSEVVERYSLTGHAFPHFSAPEIEHCLCAAGFHEVRVEPVYDPFVLRADSEEQARRALAGYLIDMYGLETLLHEVGLDRALDRVYGLADRIFRYDYSAIELDERVCKARIGLEKRDGQVWIELPRVALVGVGTKLSDAHSS